MSARTLTVPVRVIAIAMTMTGTLGGCVEPDAPSIRAFNDTGEVVTLTIAGTGNGEQQTRDLDPDLATTLTDGTEECTNIDLTVAHPGSKPFDMFEGYVCKGDSLRIEDDGITLDPAES